MRKRSKNIIIVIICIPVLFIFILVINLIIFEKNASVISEGHPIDDYGHIRSALLVIDIQEATTGEVSQNAYYHENSDSLIGMINRTVDCFDSREGLIIYIRGEVTNPFINLLNNSFAKGSQGAQYDKRLVLKKDFDVVKSRNDAFSNTKLDDILINYEISDLYIVGLDAAYCLNITAKAALNRKYNVHVIEDAILSESDIMKDSMVRVFKDEGMNIQSLDKLLFIKN